MQTRTKAKRFFLSVRIVKFWELTERVELSTLKYFFAKYSFWLCDLSRTAVEITSNPQHLPTTEIKILTVGAKYVNPAIGARSLSLFLFLSWQEQD